METADTCQALLARSILTVQLAGLQAWEAGNTAGMEDAYIDQDEGENDHGNAGDPRDDVERARIDLIAH